MGRSPLNIHCHLAVKLSERASFNKFNKNFKSDTPNMRIFRINLKYWDGQHSIIHDTEDLIEVAQLSNFEINPARSFIRRCKNPEIVNHLQMLRVLELPAQLAGSSYLRLRLHLVFNSLGLLITGDHQHHCSALHWTGHSIYVSLPNSVIFWRKVNLKISFRVLNLKLRKFSPEF